MLHCADRSINLYQTIIAWYEDKLRGRKGVAASVPELCISLDLEHGLAIQQLPKQQAPLPIPSTEVRPLSSGWLTPSSFIALQTISEPSALIGIPRLKLKRSAGTSTLFARLEVQRADGRREILSEQVTPLGAESEVEMMAVSGLLQPGDVLGLNVSGFSDQYLFNSSWRPTSVTLAGTIELPGSIAMQPQLARHD